MQLSSGHPPCNSSAGIFPVLRSGRTYVCTTYLSGGNVARWEFAIDVSGLHQMVRRQRIALRRVDRYASKGSGLPSALTMWNRTVWIRTLPTLNCKLDTFYPA